jgi:hypothetical protein
MTIEEIKATKKPFLTPEDLSEALGSDKHNISLTARTHPERIGYPFTFSGNRMKIPTEGFIAWYTGKTT